MSDSPLASAAGDNPFRAPTTSSEAPPTTPELDPWMRLEASNVLRKTRGCYKALGLIHCFFGIIGVGLGGLGIVALLEAGLDANPVIYVTTTLLAFTVVVNLSLGAGALFLQSWAAWGTIGYGALSLGLDLLFGGLGGCSTIFAVVLVVLALTIVLFERKLKTFGVSKHAEMRHGMIVPSVDPAVGPPAR